MGERTQLEHVDASSSVEQLQAGIAQTREDLSETMDAIHARLAPRTLVNHATAAAKGAAERSLQNPLMAVFVGATIGCIAGLMRRRARLRASV